MEDRCRSIKELKQNDHTPHPLTHRHPPPQHTPGLDLKEMKSHLVKDICIPVLTASLLVTIAKLFKQARLTISGHIIHIYACIYRTHTHTIHTHRYVIDRYVLDHNSAFKKRMSGICHIADGPGGQRAK